MDELTKYKMAFEAQSQELSTARDKIKELRGYAKHGAYCDKHERGRIYTGALVCDCGLDELLKESD